MYSALDALIDVATLALNVPPTDATLALNVAISYALALNLLSTDVENALTLPIPTTEPLITPGPATYIEEPPVKFNEELLPKFILESLTATALLKFTVPVTSTEPVICWSP